MKILNHNSTVSVTLYSEHSKSSGLVFYISCGKEVVFKSVDIHKARDTFKTMVQLRSTLSLYKAFK